MRFAQFISESLLASLVVLPLGLAAPAHANFIDFTDASWGNLFAGGDFPVPPTSFQTVFNAGGPGFDVSATVASASTQVFLDTTETLVGTGASNVCIGGVDGGPVFACNTDGLGAGTSNSDAARDVLNGDELLTITISQLVDITALYFLDMFSVGGNRDDVVVDFQNGSSDIFSASNSENDPVNGTGYAAFSVANQQTTTLTFRAGNGGLNGPGSGSFALAGIEFNIVGDTQDPVGDPGVNPVPLPTSALFLFSGIGVLALRRRWS